jgi:GT2 family glycosyltransferase
MTQKGITDFSSYNGFSDGDGNLFFTSTDPQIVIDDITGTAWLKIRYHIIIVSNYEHFYLLACYKDRLEILDRTIKTAEKEKVELKEAAEREKIGLKMIAEKEKGELKEAVEREKAESKEAAEKEKAELKETIDNLAYNLSHYQTHYHAAIAQRNVLQERINTVESSYQAIVNSEFWRMTKPFRFLLNSIKRILKHTPLVKHVYKFLSSVKNFGVKETLKKTKRFLQRKTYKLEFKNILPEAELTFQKSARFSRNIKFSILVPLYNTPEKFLEEMIASVKGQTYENWELCLADGSDKNHGHVKNICKKHAGKDSRIIYKKLDRNLGISGNTNECVAMSSGEYIALLDHDDLLHPSALYEAMKIICAEDADVIYTDEDKVDGNTRAYSEPHFKPDFAIDNLRAYNYICHLTIFKRSLLDKVGLFNPIFDGAQDHDMILRLTEKSKKIIHIPKILYHWRITGNSTSLDTKSKPYVAKAGIDAVSGHLKRCGLDAEVIAHKIYPTIYRIKYKIIDKPLVSIIIPNKDHVEDIKKCINSIINKSTYSHCEIIIVENGSTAKEIFNYYDELKNSNIRIVYWHSKFNYSEINNFGRKNARGEYIVLLNNDIEIISPDWIEEMLMLCQRRDIGAVGAKLYYTNGTIQHGGIIAGIGGVAGHSHKYFPKNHDGYFARLLIQQDLSAVTAACMMVKGKVFDEIHGMDPAFAVAFNDVDFCMRIRKAGYLIAWTPYAEAYHYESKSRGLEDTPEKQIRFSKEVLLFQSRWAKELAAGDPYYNPNLTLDREDFSVR